MDRLPEGHRDEVNCPGCGTKLTARPVLGTESGHQMVVLRHLTPEGQPMPDRPDRRVITQMSRETYEHLSRF